MVRDVYKYTKNKSTHMNVLPFADHTTEELLHAARTQARVTDLEIELSDRLELAADQIKQLEETVGDNA